MRSFSVISGENALAQQFTNLRADARGGSFLLAQQMLGFFALSTNPTNTKTLTLVINGSSVVLTFVTSIGSTPGNVLIGATAAATAANALALLNQPQTTTATGVALSTANQTLVSYLSYALPSGGTTLYILDNNTALYAPRTSFTASTTATSDSFTAQTLQLFVHPGTVYVNGTRVIFLGSATPTVTAPASNPRIDVLTIDSSGTLAWTTGAENASPSAPTYPANKVPICELFNVTSETVLVDFDNQASGKGYIYNDVRTFLQYQFNPLSIPSNLIADVVDTRDLGSLSVEWNNLYVKTVNASSAVIVAGQAIQPSDKQIFTANGTWTKPAGVNANALVLVQMWGGGGGGGGNGAVDRGGGGGGGAYVETWFLASQLAGTESITIGAGGTAGGSGASGGAGGDTSFGSLITAFGGGGGQGGSQNPGSEPGGGGGGAFSDGTAGGGGGAPNGGTNGNPGGDSSFGGGGGGNTSPNGNGGRSIYGGGGGGGGNGGSPGTGGASIYGGGGGGGGNTTGTATAGGTSVYGGAGGTGGHAAVAATAGTAPAGGGGGSGDSGNHSAAGARGEVRVYTIF